MLPVLNSTSSLSVSLALIPLVALHIDLPVPSISLRTRPSPSPPLVRTRSPLAPKQLRTSCPFSRPKPINENEQPPMLRFATRIPSPEYRTLLFALSVFQPERSDAPLVLSLVSPAMSAHHPSPRSAFSGPLSLALLSLAGLTPRSPPSSPGVTLSPLRTPLLPYQRLPSPPPKPDLSLFIATPFYYSSLTRSTPASWLALLAPSPVASVAPALALFFPSPPLSTRTQPDSA